MNISLLSTRLRITAFLPSQPLLQRGQFRQPFSLLIATGRSPTKFRSTLKLRWFLMLAIAVFGFVAVGRTSAATFTVTSTADSTTVLGGPGRGVGTAGGNIPMSTSPAGLNSGNTISNDN